MRQPSRIAAAAAFLALSTGTAAAVTGYTETALNMRRGPSTSYGVIVAIPGGAPVEVLNCSSGWCHVAWNGYEGYSSRSYLDIGADAYAAVVPPAVVANPPVYYDYDYYPSYYDRYYVTPGERFVRRGLRHLRREFRQERREDRREVRRDRRQDRRETVRDRRRDRRAERRQDVRQERRADRRQARRQRPRVERRENRREARQDRRAERRGRQQ